MTEFLAVAIIVASVAYLIASRNTRTDDVALKDSFDKGYLEGFEKAQRTYAGFDRKDPKTWGNWVCKSDQTLHKTRQALREHRRKYHAKPKAKVAKKGSRRSLAGR